MADPAPSDDMASLAVQDKPEKSKKPKGPKPQKQKPAQGQKKENKEGLGALKEVDFASWYTQVITKSELIEFYDISGCYILRPWSYSIWETLTRFFDAEIKQLDVENVYFPLFVAKARLETEKDHIEGFAAEVAWVTHSGSSKLEEPVAIRPTSETVMYPTMAKWIRSHRDLPMKINQWCNVVRWEFKHPTPFIRSREFLWQEGHTAHATLPEAEVEVLDILRLYQRSYEEILAVPVIRGKKSEKEKFAGGLYTTTVEAFVPAVGRAVQGATSHCLGQNFANMFNISFESETGTREKVWQNSWGMTTRTIGVMIMVHGDNKGLVLPPRAAPIEVVVIPIVVKGKEDIVRAEAAKVADELKAAGIRVKLDSRVDKNPGWKFNYYELKGVPLRIEIGPKDIENNAVFVSRRDTGEKDSMSRDGLAGAMQALCSTIQGDMLKKVSTQLRDRIKLVVTWADFMTELNAGNMLLTPWCDVTDCEEDVKKRSAVESKAQESEAPADDARALSGAAKTLCKPFDGEMARFGIEQMHGGKSALEMPCFACGKTSKEMTLWGRSY